NTGSLVKTGYTFAGWNTAANGSGTAYSGGDTFAMGSSNVTLYAQWTENTYSVTYDGNANTGGAVPTDGTSYHNGDTATVLGNTGSLVRTGYTF
ncbi:InlB B-repeat-containing protein, partial [Desulfatiferula olefinivorans]